MTARTLIIVTALAVTTPALSAQVQRGIEGRLSAMVAAYHDAGLFQGAVLVSMGGKVVYRGACGLANVEWGIPNAVDTRFSIASLGKALTAAMVLQLVDEKKVRLDDPIGRYVPEYRKDLGARLTVRQLLAHSSGLPPETKPWLPHGYRGFYSLQDVIRHANGADLVGEPGTAFRYSNIGYNLCARLIETITAMSFAAALERRILDPAAMRDTGIAHRAPLIRKRAAGYDRLPSGEFVNAAFQDQSFAVGAGGLYSTIDDMSRWDRALDDDGFLSPQSRKLMFTRGLGGAGFGWAIGKYRMKNDPTLRNLSLGFGGTSGFASVMTRILDRKHAIVILANIRQVPQQRMVNALTNILVGYDPKPPRKSHLQDVLEVLLSDGVPAAIQLHRGFAPRPGPSEINAAGYVYLGAGRTEEAVKVFTWNVAAHPDYANGYDSLGEGLERAGRIDRAIAAYERALHLDPKNTNAARRIKALKTRKK